MVTYLCLGKKRVLNQGIRLVNEDELHGVPWIGWYTLVERRVKSGAISHAPYEETYFSISSWRSNISEGLGAFWDANRLYCHV